MSTKISQKQINELDAKFEQKLESAVLHVSDTEFTPDKAKERRTKANASDLDFCKIYFRNLFNAPFNDIAKEVATWESGNYTLGGSRRWGKSAFTYVGKVIKHIATGKGGVVNISLQDEDGAKERTSMLSRIIQNNKLLCFDYGIEVMQDLKGYHIFQADNGQTTLIATSVRQGLRSLMDDQFKRFKLSVSDDLYSRQNVSSQAHQKKVVNFVVSEVWGMMEPDGLSITIGNAITEDAPIETIRKEYTEDQGRHFSLPALNAKGESTWPEKYTTEDIIELFKSQLPYDVWMGDYMDSPVEVGEIFEPDWLRYPLAISMIKIVASITAVDPSHGDSPAACDKGSATVGVDEKNHVHVLDQYLRKEDYLLFFDYLKEVNAKMPFHKVILFENDFAQWNLASPYYDQWREKNEQVLPIVLHNSKDSKTEHRGADKESRILNLVHPHQTGQLTYAKELKDNPDHLRYKNQNYLRFGAGKSKVDGLDALATAYMMIWGYITTGAFKSLKKRKFDHKQMEGWFR